MIRTFFRIPKVDSQIKDPSKALCPRCGSGTHVHGHKPRQVSDPKIEHARTQRRQCKACQKTFILRPEGVGRGRATTRTRALAFIWYMLGLSYDGVVIALEAQGMSFSKQTVHHWIQALWAQANHLRRRVRQGTVRFLGLDGTVYQVQGRKEAVQIATDLVQGDVLGIELMAEEDAAAIQALLEQYKKKYHVELLTTDEAAVYGAAAEGAGLPHQLCRTHVKKALPHRARKILSQAQQQHHPQLPKIEEFVNLLCQKVKDELPDAQQLGMQIYRAFKGAPSPGKDQKASLEYRMYLLGLDVVQQWKKVFTDRPFRTSGLLDGTNNTTERAIGLAGKIRYRSMRGFKSKPCLRRYLEAAAWLRRKQREAGPEGFVDLRPLFTT